VILYLDTSTLFKLYVDEAGSDAVHAAVADAETVAVCRIAWAEAMSALARRGREVPADQEALDLARQALSKDWPAFLIMEVTQALVEQAGDFADTFGLRGYDSVQLAAAHLLQRQGQRPVTFACFDKRLSKAAKVLGLTELADVPG
jgi:uncharacterized protein